jgi:hypothetical protein
VGEVGGIAGWVLGVGCRGSTLRTSRSCVQWGCGRLARFRSPSFKTALPHVVSGRELVGILGFN